MTLNMNTILLLLGFSLYILAAPASGENVRAENCDPPRLTLVHSLDFGDVRVPTGTTGFLRIDPEGTVSQANTVLLVQNPTPGEMLLCGLADQRIQIRLDQPSVALTAGGRPPVAQQLDDITLSGQGIHLSRVGAGRWETRLPASGRATVRIGATLHLGGSGQHGPAGTNISLDVEPL